MEFAIPDEAGNTSVTFFPPTGRDGEVPEKFRLLATHLTETPQFLAFKTFIASIHNRSFALRAGGVILEHMVSEADREALETHANVLLIEYVAWLCVTVTQATSPYTIGLQSQDTLSTRLVPELVLDVVLGAMLTVADVNHRFLPIKVERAFITGSMPIGGSRFRETHMSPRGRSVVDLVNVMGSEWQNVTWLAPPGAVLTGTNWRKFAADNRLEEGDLCVLEVDPRIGHNRAICCNQSRRFKLKIKVHVFHMAAAP
ncbi:hypothetical protein BDL97_03G092800 [Sphagnum fallax]|nr:hypothetical protein BDL97_03G092800 [Sphagnum fallax]